jgi:hypothetical protein
MAALDRELPAQILELAARPGRVLRHPMALSRGCLRLDIITASGLRPVRAEWWTSDHRQLGGGSPMAAQPTIFSCGAARHRVLEVHHAVGPVLIVKRADPSAPAVLVEHPAAAAALLQRLDSAGDARPFAALSAARSHTLVAGRAFTQVVDVAAHSCRRITAATGPTAGGLHLALQFDGRRRRRQAAQVVSERVCATDEPLKLDVSIRVDAPGVVLLVDQPEP